MIKVGTLCYLTNGHPRAGQCCTVTGPLYWEGRGQFDDVTGQHFPPAWVYPIAIASGETWPSGFAASPPCLIPIAPPGLTAREDKRDPVEAEICG